MPLPRRFPLVAPLVALAACEGRDPFPSPPPLRVTPTSINGLAPGDTVRLVASDDRGRPSRDARFLTNGPLVARVDSIGGLLTALSPGHAIVTATVGTSPDWSSYSVPVTVLGLALEPDGGTTVVGGTIPFRATLLVGGPADYGPLRWSTTDSLVATIDSLGVLRGHRPGPVRVVVTASANPRVRAERTVSVVSVGGFPISVLAAPRVITLVPGAAAQITAVVSPLPVPPPDSLRGASFTSSDTTIATVNAAGVVFARRAGAATILVAARIAPTVITEVAVLVTAPPTGGPTLRLLAPLAGAPPRELPPDSLRGRVFFRVLAEGADDEIGLAELWLGDRLASPQPVRTRVAGGTEYLFAVDTDARDAAGARLWPAGRTPLRVQYTLARRPDSLHGVVRSEVTLLER